MAHESLAVPKNAMPIMLGWRFQYTSGVTLRNDAEK